MTRDHAAFRRILRALLGLGLVAGAFTAQSATFTVTNTNDSGPGSLRQALADAEVSGDVDTIDFAPGLSGTTVLAAELPDPEQPDHRVAVAARRRTLQ